ncbi:MAG: multiubiquitin domain-containing protein [Chloroflexi bacterium]|nr:multiubiquitin domain-containing protein [Chloroflexota bacterium]
MTTQNAAPSAPAVNVTIIVNTKPVDILGPRVTGLQIKEAAIAQDLQITLDFSLSQIRPGGRPKVVGNDDVVTVNKNSEFTAVNDDDDS